jgi:Na+/phosphate symporter
MPAKTVKDIKKDIYLMLHKIQEMLDLTADAFMKSKPSKLDEAMEISKEIHRSEDDLTEALAKMAPENGEARIILTVPSHLEKIATSVERIIDQTRNRIRDGMLFSDKAIQETAVLFKSGEDILKKAGDAVVTGNKAGADAVMAESDKMVRMANDFSTAHENRLASGEASPKSSTTYLCILYAFEDLAWHAKETVRKMAAA